jgi:hypothetical protein
VRGCAEGVVVLPSADIPLRRLGRAKEVGRAYSPPKNGGSDEVNQHRRGRVSDAVRRSGRAAGTNDILIGLDEKITYGPDGLVNGPPGKEAVLVMDVSNPAKPRIRASLPLMNSLLGPPTNLQITPDGRLGLSPTR